MWKNGKNNNTTHVVKHLNPRGSKKGLIYVKKNNNKNNNTTDSVTYLDLRGFKEGFINLTSLIVNLSKFKIKFYLTL